MKRIPCLLFAAFLFCLVPSSQAQEPLQPVKPQHAPDGGTKETFAPIFIPSTPNAPFTATVTTEWIRHLPDGSNITLKNHRTVARDSKGRIFQERAYFVPDDGKHESTITQTEISDPEAHEIYICKPVERVCRLEQFYPASFASSLGAVVAQADSAAGGVENLGKQTIEGLETVGSRETRVIEAATIGNDSPLLERREFWYSPQLGINLVTKRQDARFGSQQNFDVSNIALGEPDAKLFDVPADYKILDTRRPPEARTQPASLQN